MTAADTSLVSVGVRNLLALWRVVPNCLADSPRESNVWSSS